MKNLLSSKVKYITSFANQVFRTMMQKRYGIRVNNEGYDATGSDIDWIRYQLVKFQENEDYDILTETAIRYRTWLAVNYDALQNQYARPYGRGRNGGSPQNISMNYNYGANESQNIIEVNAGGCLTRINLNPAITINNSSKYEHFQTTPASTWVIVHNLGFTPNVFTTDLAGIEFEGVVDPIDQNTLHIIFSEPVAGYAYLS